MSYIEFMFQGPGHFFGCFLLLLTAAILLLVFLDKMLDRLTRFVYVWRFPECEYPETNYEEPAQHR